MFLKGSILIFALFVVYAEGNSLFYKSQTREKECVRDGMMCDDCKTLVYCVQQPNGSFNKDIAEFCDAGKSCITSGNTASCSSAQNDECDDNVINFEFKCHQSGIFPHPFDCKKYYICVNDGDTVVEEPIHNDCKTGYGYDPMTSLCRKVLPNGRCLNRLVDPCPASARFSAIPGNPYLYALCLTQQEASAKAVFFPHVFHCNNNWIFNVNSCQAPQSGLDANGKCVGSGNYFDDTDCRKFKECSGAGRDPISKTCANGLEFNPLTRLCVAFTC